MDSTSPRVAIIGSGPAGYSASMILVKNNFEVIIFDSLSTFGGMLAYGIPEFRLPLKLVEEKISVAKAQGIIFENKKIDSVKSLLKEFGGHFDFVIIAVGCGEGQKMGVIGENKKGVIDALDFLLENKLKNNNLVSSGEKVCVIGGGNSAMDAARVAKKIGAQVELFYRRTENEMPALKTEIQKAKEENIVLNFLKSPVEFKGKQKLSSVVFEEFILGEKDSSGRARPISTGKKEELSFNKAIIAIGQQPNFDWLNKEGIITNGKIVLVNEKFQTSLSNVYAAGDCVTGPKTIATATLSGINCANSIISVFKNKNQ